MSLFTFNIFRASEELTPPQLREPKMLAWLRVLLRPVQYMNDSFLKDYCQGADYPHYDNSTTYNKYDRIIFYNRSVYECRVSSSVGVMPSGDTLSLTNWRKIQEICIGVDERVKYNGQIIVFEEAINKWFFIDTAPFIWVNNSTSGIPNFYPWFLINVPNAQYLLMGATNTERDAAINEFARRYIYSEAAIIISTF